MEERIFREYDIRGIYGKDLTEEISCLIGKAFVSLACRELKRKPEKISIGMDARLSSECLKQALMLKKPLTGCLLEKYTEICGLRPHADRGGSFRPETCSKHLLVIQCCYIVYEVKSCLKGLPSTATALPGD